MKVDTWMPIYPADYLADTTHLSAEEHGAYFLLLLNYWKRGAPLPDNDAQLARMSAVGEARWSEVRTVIEPFFDVSGGVWRHSRVDRELEKARYHRELRSSAGRAGASARWQDDGKDDGKGNGKGNGKRIADADADASGNRIVIPGDSEQGPGPLKDDEIGKPLIHKGGDGKRIADAMQFAMVEGAKSDGKKMPSHLSPSTSHLSPSPPTGCDGPSPAAGREVWESYAEAFAIRYGVPATRNAKVNGQIAQFVKRVPAEEAPAIAAWYVRSNKRFYVDKRHPIDCLLKDAEALRSDWLMGVQRSEVEARQADATQARANVFQHMLPGS